jgi:hypothetical protein
MFHYYKFTTIINRGQYGDCRHVQLNLPIVLYYHKSLVHSNSMAGCQEMENDGGDINEDIEQDKFCIGGNLGKSWISTWAKKSSKNILEEGNVFNNDLP